MSLIAQLNNQYFHAVEVRGELEKFYSDKTLTINGLVEVFDKCSPDVLRYCMSRFERLFLGFYPWFSSFNIKSCTTERVLNQLSNLPDEQSRIAYMDNFSIFALLNIPEHGRKLAINSSFQEKFASFKSVKTKVFFDLKTSFFSHVHNSFLPQFKKIYQKGTQIALQASIVKLESSDDKYASNNLIVDPSDFIPEDACKQIIDALYVPGPDVVYATYTSLELKLLRAMQVALRRDPYRISYCRKIEEIIKKTVDLSLWFSISQTKKVIVSQQLKGKHSLKDVVDVIPKNILTYNKVVSYSDLSCQNELQSQMIFHSRAKGACPDWDSEKKNLIKYCENDVRTMIAIYKWADELMKEPLIFFVQK